MKLCKLELHSLQLADDSIAEVKISFFTFSTVDSFGFFQDNVSLESL